MDYETISAEDFGRSLQGLGLNLLVRDVPGHAAFLTALFDMQAQRVTPDFAILIYHGQVFQLHSDGSFGDHPLLGLVPESPPRGAGIELRLYHSDPDLAVGKAGPLGGTVLQKPTDKPHGLREATILCPDGYAWVPSRPLPANP